MSEKPRQRPETAKSYTVRVVSERRRPVDPAAAKSVAYPVNLPFEAYKHLLSGKPYIRQRRPQKPATDAGSGT